MYFPQHQVFCRAYQQNNVQAGYSRNLLHNRDADIVWALDTLTVGTPIVHHHSSSEVEHIAEGKCTASCCLIRTRYAQGYGLIPSELLFA